MKKRPYITAMIALVALFLIGRYYITDNVYIEIISTILAIIAGVAFWMEFRNNERINEAQLIMELNDQFISNPQFSYVELELEKYYAQYMETQCTGGDSASIPFDIDLDVFNENRQSLVNYLVHLEGIAALVDEGVLHLKVITNLMAYRYFIAVNNPVVQQKELLPYRNYYQGIFNIYEQWSKQLGNDKIPMADNALSKYIESES